MAYGGGKNLDGVQGVTMFKMIYGVVAIVDTVAMA